MNLSHVRRAIERRNHWPAGSLDWLCWHRTAWKLLQLACGRPAVEWTDNPRRVRHG